MNRGLGSAVRAPAMVAAVVAVVIGGLGNAAWSAPVEIFPSGALFRPLLADPREAHHSVRYLVGPSDARGEASFGDTFGLARIDGPLRVQFGVQGSVFTRFNPDVDSVGFLDVNSADYTLFLPIDVQFDGWALRMGLGHLSSHLGESEVQRRIRYDGAPFFDRSFLYRRDYVRLIAAWDVSDQFRVYGGASIGVHVTPEQPRTATQAGVEWRGALHPLGSIVRQWFVATDLQAWAESDWAANANMESGLRLARTDGARGVRIALSGYAGRSLQRVLADERERYLGFGFVFEF